VCVCVCVWIFLSVCSLKHCFNISAEFIPLFSVKYETQYSFHAKHMLVLQSLRHILKMITEIGLSGGRGKLRYVLPVAAVAQGRTI
jgi:hypothetical protein